MGKRTFFIILALLNLIFFTAIYTTIRQKLVNKEPFHQVDYLTFINKPEFNYAPIKVTEIDCALLFKTNITDSNLKEKLFKEAKAFNGTQLNLNATRFIQHAK